jgi:hypothetical protein
MTRKELTCFTIFLAAMALIAVPRGWKEVCWNVGIGALFWMLGRAVGTKKENK